MLVIRKVHLDVNHADRTTVGKRTDLSYSHQPVNYATMRVILLRRLNVKKLLIAVGVLLIAMAFEIAPFWEEWLGWILFIALLLFGAYTIYDAMQTEK